ncbi:hypothetical protein Slin15195_G032330 [Septoria linicola]|uniref:Uncharacterized protein n=1 Tax=Septoria linicola TaxID=215465 RepID=A0A9Q9AL05_9PEZI|nr:hypothetical protein Slin14017_G031350 [Septoria linicola]USW49914.1 hypothetical protein Slin15195_G032330 [Septoria linicola]
MDDRILDGPLGLVQQQIGRLQAESQKSEALLNEARAENRALRDGLAIREEQLKEHCLAQEELSNMNAQLETLREVAQSLKDVIQSRDEESAGISEQLEKKEHEVQLLKSRLKRAKKKSNDPASLVRAPQATSGVPFRKAETNDPPTNREQGEGFRMEMHFPCFQVLKKKGSRYYRDMHDGGHLIDGGRLLHQLAQSFRPSRQIPCMLRAHEWTLSGFAKEQSPESPWPQSVEAPEFVLDDTAAVDARDSPLDAQQHRTATEDVQMTSCKMSPRSDSPPAGHSYRPLPEPGCLADLKSAFTAPNACNMDDSIPSAFRDERREHRSVPSTSSPTPSGPERATSTMSSVQTLQYQEESRKRVRDFNMTDAEFTRAVKARRLWCKEKEALTQAHEALSLERSKAQTYANYLQTQLQAVQQEAHRHGIQMRLQAHAQVLQEAENLRRELNMSEARVAQLEARYQQLDWQRKSSEQQHAQYVRDRNKRMEDKNTDLTKCNHTVTQLQIHLAAVIKQNTLYNDHLLQQGGKVGELTSEVSEKDLTISHLRKCRIAMRWHVAAIKAQREAASVGSSAVAADLEALRQEVKRLTVLLQTARLARMRAEHSRSVAEAELQEVAGRFDAASTELVTLRAKESLAVNEIQTLKSRSACQTKVLQQHEACVAEQKWLDDRYPDAFDQLQGLRKQLEISRSQMVDSGTDAIQPSRTIEDTNSPVTKITTQLLTPTSSMSPPPRLRSECNSGETVTTPLRVEIPRATKFLQLPTPSSSTEGITLPSRPDWTVPETPVQQAQHRAAPPKQPKHLERGDELRPSYQQEWSHGQGRRESRGEELFPHRTGAIATRPPMGGRSWSDMYRRPVDAYRPR